MAESDVAIAALETSAGNNHTQDTTPPPEEAAPPPNQTSELEKEEKETQKEEEAEVVSEKAAAGEEAGEGNPDLKRKHEVQEEMEKQLEGAGNRENTTEEGEEREGGETKRQRTETEEAQELVQGEAHEEEAPVGENGEHGIKDNSEQTAEEDVKKDDFTPAEEDVQNDGSSDATRKIEVPNHRVGVLIGKAGDTIRTMQKLSGARIQIVKDSDTAPDATTRVVEILGSVESINKAEELIKDVLAEADAGRPPPLLHTRGFHTSQSSTSPIEIQVPNEKVGSIIGKGGQMIKDLQARSGAHILLVPLEDPEEEDVKERTVRLTGSRQQIEAAKSMIRDVINQMKLHHTGRPHSQNRGGPGHRQTYGSRGPGSRGHGSQHQWGPPRQHHSPSTGYNKYPNQRGKNYPPQYPPNPHQNYGNYPPARPGGSGAGMGPTWDQRAPYSGTQQQHQYGTGGGYQYGQQGYGAPNSYSQSTMPPQQSYQAPPSQQYYGQQPTQAGYQQQPYNAMYPQGQVAGGSYGGVTAQQQNPYAMGQYGQSYSQPAGADGYSQQYAQQYGQQAGQVAPGYGQAGQVGSAYTQPTTGAQDNMNYGYQGGVADPSAGYNAAAGQAGYGQMMPVSQAGYAQQQPVNQGAFDQGVVQPAAGGTAAQAAQVSGAPPAAGQWQG